MKINEIVENKLQCVAEDRANTKWKKIIRKVSDQLLDNKDFINEETIDLLFKDIIRDFLNQTGSDTIELTFIPPPLLFGIMEEEVATEFIKNSVKDSGGVLTMKGKKKTLPCGCPVSAGCYCDEEDDDDDDDDDF